MTLRERLTANFSGIPFALDTFFDNGDQWVVDQMVTWQCGDATETQEFRYSGVWPNAPVATRLE